MSLKCKSKWGIAIQNAKLVDAENAADFLDIQTSKKRKLVDTISTDESTNEKNTIETDGNEGSGFCQPLKLASFVKKIVKNEPIEEATESNESTPNTTNEIDSRQICRAWLKNHFLKLGSPCNKGDQCPRRHEVVGNPDRLYSDFSFKGLQSKQQKIILEALKNKPSVTSVSNT